MAGLTGTSVKNTYKDLLTIAGPIANQGIESSVKQIFDGEGIGSPVWLSTNLLQVGTASSDAALSVYGNLSVYGKVSCETLTLIDSNDDPTDLFIIDISGTVQTTVPINTNAPITSSSTLTLTGTENLKLSGSTSKISRGTNKGNIELKDGGVSLQKDGANLLEVKDDGEILVKQLGGIEDSFPSSPSDGSMVMKYDAAGNNQGLFVYNS
jgi:hypothetical protein|tara:strand:- start:104 stop:733 length:630 start_codon:yes stop_codon:yes gene_type:complete